MGSDARSAERLLGLGLGFQRAMTVLAAVELGVFDLLTEAGPLNRADICARLGLAGRGVADFLDALLVQELLTRDESGCYGNTPSVNTFLVRGRPDYIGGLLELMHDIGYPRWTRLSEALRTGRPQGVASDGADFFAVTYQDPAQLALFATAMGGYTAVTAPLVAQRFPWADYRTFADIGCASGDLAVRLAGAHGQLTGVGFDLPALRRSFDTTVTTAGLADRLRFHAGDFMVDELPTADVLVFSHILHDFGQATKQLLLDRAARALAPGGVVLVQECFIDDERRTGLAGMLSSLHMLLETPDGFDFTMADCEQWLAAAGFGEFARIPLTATQSIVVGTRLPC